MRVCETDGCDNRYLAKGLCNKHYQRVYKYGTIEIKFPRDINVVNKILRHIKVSENNCWKLECYVNSKGYGHVRDDTGKMRHAHVIMYEHKHGRVPESRELDHKCRVRACVNPEHLEVVTHRENVRRGNAGENWVKLNRDFKGRFIGKKELI